MPDNFKTYAWPADRLDAAVTALCRHAGYPLPRTQQRSITDLQSSLKDIESVLQRMMAQSNVEFERIETGLGNLQSTVAQSTPAILQINWVGNKYYLIVLQVNGRQAHLFGPNETKHKIKVESLAQLVAAPMLNDVGPSLDQVLKHIGSRSVAANRFRLASEMFSTHTICVGWQIRLAPTAELPAQASELGLQKLLGGTLLAAIGASGLWVVSWWLLGWAILSGRLDLGWLIAWMLAIASMIPFRILVTRLSGRFTVLASSIIKRRLMFGAVYMNADQFRGEGVGRLLGRVLESEVLDTVAVTGGFLALLAGVDLCLAFFVLSIGAANWNLAVLLLLTIAASGWLASGYYRRRKSWTDCRQRMTDELIENMQGHRTRLIQLPTAIWNQSEDGKLCQYVESSRSLDRQFQLMRIGLPRTWMLASLVIVAWPFVFADPTSTELAITIGGILLVYFALQNLVDAAEKLIAALIAWQQVRPLWNALPKARTSEIGANDLQGTGEGAVLETQGLQIHVDNQLPNQASGIDLGVAHDDRIRLTGKTGSGKSVLAATLAGLRSPGSGAVCCGGIDQQTYGERWNERVALATAPAQNHLMLGTFAFNVLLGRHWPAGESDLILAETVCRQMGLGCVIDQMPCGMHEIVGETGWQLSHGERCRLFAARAILQDPNVVVIDGLFSSLDPATHANVLAAIEQENRAFLLIDN